MTEIQNKTNSESNENAKIRCEWCTDDPLYQHYHDNEWGVPVYDEKKLFEFLILEGAQAGLSWITVLKKRDHYRKVFDGFDPVKIAQYDDRKITSLLNDAGIIRNKLKVQSTIRNAKAYLALKASGVDFSEYLWQFVGHKPIQNRFRSLSEIPAETDESRAMSKQLKKDGFNFVGPTICYAFMQATGMVNDHLVHCYRHAELS